MPGRSEEHTSELQSHSEISYAVFCLKKKKVRQISAKNTFQKSVTKHKALKKGFFFNDTATTEIYTNHNTLSLHDALPISRTQARNPETDINLVKRLLIEIRKARR